MLPALQPIADQHESGDEWSQMLEPHSVQAAVNAHAAADHVAGHLRVNHLPCIATRQAAVAAFEMTDIMAGNEEIPVLPETAATAHTALSAFNEYASPAERIDNGAPFSSAATLRARIEAPPVATAK